jgi:hypothetical protein
MSKKTAESTTPASIRPRTKAARSLPIPAVLQILVECENEGRQRELYERLKEEGYPCRVLTL